jgi:hypothetical protein
MSADMNASVRSADAERATYLCEQWLLGSNQLITEYWLDQARLSFARASRELRPQDSRAMTRRQLATAMVANRLREELGECAEHLGLARGLFADLVGLILEMVDYDALAQAVICAWEKSSTARRWR